MTVTENIEIMMRFFLQFFTIGEQELVLFTFKFFFPLDVADPAPARPELCNAHATVRMNPPK